MSVLNTWLAQEGYQKFSEAKKLYEDTTSNPENEPYFSKYKSREIIKTLKNKLEDFSEDGITLLKDEIVSETDGDIKL